MEAAVYVPSPAVLEPDLHLPGPQLELDSQGLLLLLQEKKVAFSNAIKFLARTQHQYLYLAMSGRE
jgi:hypothetical protein